MVIDAMPNAEVKAGVSFTGGIGICHVYVDAGADLERAVDIVENAKVQRPSVCNALDTLLVHREAAGTFLPAVAARLAQSGVELRMTGGSVGWLDDRCTESVMERTVAPAPSLRCTIERECSFIEEIAVTLESASPTRVVPVSSTCCSSRMCSHG